MVNDKDVPADDPANALGLAVARRRGGCLTSYDFDGSSGVDGGPPRNFLGSDPGAYRLPLEPLIASIEGGERGLDPR